VPFFPWILLWVSLPLVGSVLLFFSSLDKERSKKVALWCMGWFFALSFYLIVFRSRMSEYYPFLDLYLKVDPQILWAAIGSALLVALCIFMEGGFALGLGLLALIVLCLVIHQWMWFWVALEFVFGLNIIFFGLAVRTHRVLLDSFWRHLVFVVCMALFIYTNYWDSGTFKNSTELTSRSITYLGLGLLSYTPVWSFFGVWASFFSKSKLLGIMMLGVFFWVVFFSVLRGQNVPQGFYYGIAGLTTIALLTSYRKKYDMNHFLVQLIFVTGPLYFCVFLHHSFESLILVMMNTGIVLGVISRMTELVEKKSIFFYISLIWSMGQPFFFLWKNTPFLKGVGLIGLLFWLSFCFFRHILPKQHVLWERDKWAIGLIAWNIGFPLIYEFVS